MDPREPLEMQLTPYGDTPADVLACELEVLHHWFGDTPELLEHAYGRYAADTAFVAVRHRGEAVGFARVIRPGRLPLKTLADVEGDPWRVDAGRAAAEAGIDPAATWDCATLGVRRFTGSTGSTGGTGGTGGTGVPAHAGLALFRAFYLALRANRVRSVVAILDALARRAMRSHGLRPVPIPGTAAAPYMGSHACAPLYFDVAEAGGAASGRPVPGLVEPPPEQLVLPAGPLA